MKRYIAIYLALLGLACAQKEESNSADIQEPAQQIGDVMASIDESGGSTGELALFKFKQSHEKLFARKVGVESTPWNLRQLFLPKAEAAFCSSSALFSSCANNVVTRNFEGCSVGLSRITIDGSVTLTWDDAAVDNTCQVASAGHSITRDPNFTISGRRGATLSVNKTASLGQKLEYLGGNQFKFTNDGIRRVFSGPLGANFDFTNTTNGDGLLVEGLSRNGRVLNSNNGGSLRVLNNNTGVHCDYTPQDVTWELGCNCPTSGTWAASCSDGKESSLQIQACGEGTFTLGEESQNVIFDRCY